MSYKRNLNDCFNPDIVYCQTWERIMSPQPISLSPHHEAVEKFEDAARRLRESFRLSVLEALPGFALCSFEREWQEVAELQSIDSIPSLTSTYLMICERCVRDLLNKNYEGVATSHFEKCVSEAANGIRAKVIALRSYEGDAVRSPRKRSGEKLAAAPT
jgi:hypothetical protein